MKFYILESDYRQLTAGESSAGLSEETSVKQYYRWFFESLQRLGRIEFLKKSWVYGAELGALVQKPEAIFIPIKEVLFYLQASAPLRILRLSLGSLLSPQNLPTVKPASFSQVELVSTGFQREQTRRLLGNLAPAMEIFPPKIDTDFYFPPDPRQRREARQKEKIEEKQLHIVYAGRLIVTKGIPQILRSFDLSPMPGITVTLVGDIEKGNPIAYTRSQHATFRRYLEEEILRGTKRPWLRIQKSRDKQGLRSLFWSADLFIYPSVQPDENFGITPREAAACGVPVLSTDFCGLHPLASSMPWGGVCLYPTIFGLRFSLRQFQNLVLKAIKEKHTFLPEEYRRIVTTECDPRTAQENLEQAVRSLLKLKPDAHFYTARDSLTILKRLENSCKRKVFKYYFPVTKNNTIDFPAGAFPYGDVLGNLGLPMYQGIFTSQSEPPKVEPRSFWRGFFRIVLWEREQALLEFGFPGPRIKRYNRRDWKLLAGCAHRAWHNNEVLFTPKTTKELRLIQELVDLGYLVSDGLPQP